MILHAFALPLLNDYFLILSEGRAREKWIEREKEAEGGRGRWIKQTEVCVYQAFGSWRTDPGSIGALRSVGTV